MSGNVDNLRLILDRYPQFTKMRRSAARAADDVDVDLPGQNQKEIMRS